MTLFADGRRQAVHPHRPAIELLDHGKQQASILVIEATFIDVQQVQRQVGNRLGDMPLGANFGEITHPTQQSVGNPGRATGTAGDFEGAFRVQRQTQDARRTTDDRRQVGVIVELKTLNDAETVAQRVGQHACPGRCANQGERWQIELDRTRSRAFANHDVELEIFHGRVQHFFNDGRQAMDFVDEQHIVRLKVGQQCGEITRTLQHRPRSALD
ncbi:hypothetical protein D9M73_170720 [compost metagenome]